MQCCSTRNVKDDDANIVDADTGADDDDEKALSIQIRRHADMQTCTRKRNFEKTI